jgi:hypothetical protein
MRIARDVLDRAPRQTIDTTTRGKPAGDLGTSYRWAQNRLQPCSNNGRLRVLAMPGRADRPVVHRCRRTRPGADGQVLPENDD